MAERLLLLEHDYNALLHQQEMCRQIRFLATTRRHADPEAQGLVRMAGEVRRGEGTSGNRAKTRSRNRRWELSMAIDLPFIWGYDVKFNMM